MAVLGVLGGMGPLATLDFIGKVIRNTPARRDQDHIEIVTYFANRVPDRTDAISGQGDDPFPAMRLALRSLEQSGADLVAIPCNTAHHWHAALQRDANVPILHIVDAVMDELELLGAAGGALGILATTGTIDAGIYQERLAHRRRAFLLPDAEGQQEVMRAIRLVKAGFLADAADILEAQAGGLVDAGCAAIAMACTEIPPALARPPAHLASYLLDPTEALARASIRASGIAPVSLRDHPGLPCTAAS